MLRQSSDQRKTEILDAVVYSIIDVGYTQMTVADVATRAGVSTALVHYHFSSKAELISAALRVASDEDKQLREDIAADHMSAVNRIDRVLCGSLPSDASDASWLLWIETWGETRRSCEIREVMADLNQHELKLLVGLIDAGEAAGEFACPDPRAAAARLTALRDGLVIDYTLFTPDHPIESVVEQLRGSIKINLGLSTAEYVVLAGTPEPSAARTQ